MLGYRGKIFNFYCTSCKTEFSKYKEVYPNYTEEVCEKCGDELKEHSKTIKSARNNPIIGAAVQNAEYNPGLGMVTKNKNHRAELAKQNGLVEIGNDYKSPESMGKEFDTAREKQWEKSWDEV